MGSSSQDRDTKRDETREVERVEKPRRMEVLFTGQPVLYRLAAGRCAGEYRPALVVRAYDDGSADLTVFSRKKDGIDTSEPQLDLSHIAVFDRACEPGQACDRDVTRELAPVPRKKVKEPPPPPPPPPPEDDED